MRTLALALLIPVAVCTACSNKNESPPAPAPTASAASAPAAPEVAPALGAGPPVSSGAVADAPQTTAMASLAPAAGGAAKGDLTLTTEGLAVHITGEITGLTPGKEHGFHVHEVGDCSAPDFTSAGAHLNPTKDPHGGPKSTARHLGDIPNVKADKDGHASIDVSVQGATLVDPDGGPNQLLGKALVVHAMPDDYKTQPSGGSGDRIACGVIR
jgi:superoxide dismutase, Cu-Zn family